MSVEVPAHHIAKESKMQKSKQRSKKETVSAGAVFKAIGKTQSKHPRARKTITGIATRTVDIPKPQDDRARVVKRNPGKVTQLFEQAKGSEKHPLVVAFKDATKTYKTTLRENATVQIDETFDRLIQALTATATKIPDSKPIAAASKTAPEPSLTDRIQREREELSRPLGDVTFTKARVNHDGKTETGLVRIGAATGIFEEHSAKAEARLQELQKRWERIVGEIWKCGVQVLGRDEMKNMLLLDMGSDDLGPNDTQGEEPLFVSQDSAKSKRRVTTKEPLPDFISRPSSFSVPLRALEGVSSEVVNDLRSEVSELGESHAADLEQQIDDYQDWWRHKHAQFLSILND
ncbi:hypothetical protein BU24DRAFT_491192 [Aaosphaeria arxii CBS 175.79]|uniref:Uncharacterized protein n=1 Tax=Aaosphaeria arxii CBS 175.79 TaxID=1450172 RepID=A0A6A5Y0U1_9PLEO|nr:uncharacterized protein BU24DRAFT_491192 [Aaosphaeria arxii CBS 175.79]KAF2018174.1 hypothetical protein BU24DRAFT_491192 [Aaosphaeria arxii CBS 175.79]